MCDFVTNLPIDIPKMTKKLPKTFEHPCMPSTSESPCTPPPGCTYSFQFLCENLVKFSCNMIIHYTFISSGILCSSQPCLNGGTCEEQLLGGYVCLCTDGYIGDHCENVMGQ